MNKYKFKIEKVNLRIHGHTGFGRLNLIGPKNSINGQTNNQAIKSIGYSILNAFNKFHSTEEVDDKMEGVEVVIQFKKYKKK